MVLSGNLSTGAANGMALLHAGFSLLVAGGLWGIALGTAFSWDGVQQRTFRSVHLVATLMLGIRVALGIPCPFTVAEDTLRQTSNSVPEPPGWVQVCHRLSCRGAAPQPFDAATGLMVLATSLLYGHHLTRRRPRTSPITSP